MLIFSHFFTFSLIKVPRKLGFLGAVLLYKSSAILNPHDLLHASVGVVCAFSDYFLSIGSVHSSILVRKSQTIAILPKIRVLGERTPKLGW